MTAATVLAGCQGEDDDGGASMLDAGPATTTMCGTNVCLDLNDPANAALTKVNGTLTISVPKDRVLLIRTSTTTVQAVSDICTHLGCTVRFSQTSQILICPCHGSEYQLDGTVIQGPATRPLRQYQTQLDPTTNVLTIVL